MTDATRHATRHATGADRLRAAADRLDTTPLLRIDSLATEDQGVQGRLVGPQVQALLRDIAFTYPCECVMPRIESTCYWHIPAQQARWMRSALALADVVLGGDQ